MALKQDSECARHYVSHVQTIDFSCMSEIVCNLRIYFVNKQKKKKHRDKKRDKDKELQASLMVACLKRLLPVGLNLFAGREQELVQHCKDRFLRVIAMFLIVGYHLKETGFEEEDWIHLAQDRIQWWFLVNVVMNLLVLTEVESLFTYSVSSS